jgi:hypothetical protein
MPKADAMELAPEKSAAPALRPGDAVPEGFCYCCRHRSGLIRPRCGPRQPWFFHPTFFW